MAAGLKVGDKVVRVDRGKVLKFGSGSEFVPKRFWGKPIEGKIVGTEHTTSSGKACKPGAKGCKLWFRVRMVSDEPGEKPYSYLPSEIRKK